MGSKLLSLGGAAFVALGAHGAAPRLALISGDPFTAGVGQHRTQVEPSAATHGDTVVATFQTGRTFEGGSRAIGFSTTPDAGRTWRRGLLPLAPDAERSSDTVVAWDDGHQTFVEVSIAISSSSLSLDVARSPDGVRWTRVSRPETRPVKTEPIDKPWLVCDNAGASAFRGRCYLAYSDFTGNVIGVRTSTDGGLTWSSETGPRMRDAIGVQPVVRPDGTLVLVYLDFPRMLSAISTDGGLTFSQPVVFASVKLHRTATLRNFALPSVAIDAGGILYAVWNDCSLRPSCEANDIMLARSGDGITWSIAQAPLGTAGDRVLPTVGVDPLPRASGTHLALSFYSFRDAACREPACLLDVSVATSTNGGRRLSAPQRLDRVPARLTWLPKTVSGRMVGDYFAIPFARGRALPIVVLAGKPDRTGLHEAVYAGSLPVR